MPESISVVQILFRDPVFSAIPENDLSRLENGKRDSEHPVDRDLIEMASM